jgi:hypothetical protein
MNNYYMIILFMIIIIISVDYNNGNKRSKERDTKHVINDIRACLYGSWASPLSETAQ